MSKARTTRAQQAAVKAQLAAERARVERTRRIRAGLLGAGLVLVFGVVAAIALTSTTGEPTQDAAGTQYVADPEGFVLPGLVDESQTVALADFAGTPVVVNFFASWCVYCNEELPGFVQVAKATAGSVAFVGVDTSDPGDGVEMAERFDLAGAGFALASDVGGDPPSALWTAYGSQGLPVTAFYDAQGALVDFSPGLLTQAELEQRIATNFGVTVEAADAAEVGAPVIPLIPQGAYELLRNHPGVDSITPIDLRPAADFAAGHLDGALSLPGDEALTAADLDPNASYILYDADGQTVEQVATALHDAGFTHVYYVTGGFAAWTERELPTTR